MADPVPIDYAIAVPTFIGSSLSFLATSTVIVIQFLYQPKRHIRHVLVANLLLADWINSLNNTVSGAIFLAQGNLPSTKNDPSGACIANGWIGQISVQTIDFNIFIISVIVLISVVRNEWIASLSMRTAILICIVAWIPGLITSNVALGLNVYGYVSGNWCWIQASRLDLRYGLTHGWRIGIFILTIGIYTYIYIRLRRVFKTLRMLGGGSETTNFNSTNQRTVDNETDDTQEEDAQHILVSHSVSVTHDEEYQMDNANSLRKGSMPPPRTPGSSAKAKGQGVKPTSRMPPPPNLRKMLLMNGYPLAYIILWIPGIANRLAESTGSSPRWLTALQASTQFIGLANALTYGLSEQLRRAARQGWKNRKSAGPG